ncbi:MAG: PEGA domain-containing protein [Deltaproteobacteria bacterium]|nr:PEGA domain-containing protein [Deltaproteobacteria bacterium]
MAMAYRRTVWRSLASPGIAVVSVLAAASGFATERPTWVVGHDPALVREVCVALGGRDARPAVERFPSASALQMADYRLGLQRVDEAIAFYRKGRVDLAWGAINEAIAAFERSLAVAEDFAAIGHAYLFRADLAMARGDNSRAEEDFLAAARLAPELGLDPATTSPTVMEGYGTAVELLKNSPTGGLSVVSKPGQAIVSIDGVSRGHTPLSAVLSAGPHLAVVRLRGHETWASQVPVEADDMRQLEVVLTEASAIDIAADEGNPESVRRLAELDPAADWLVVRREPGGASYGYLPAGLAPSFGGPLALAALPAELAAIDDRAERGLSVAVPTWAWYAAGIGGGALLLAAGVGATVYVLWPEQTETRYLSVFHK